MKVKVLFLCLLFSGALLAQNYDAKDASELLQTWQTTYDLTDKQLADAQEVADRHFRNLADIVALEASDYRLFLNKRRVVNSHTERSLSRLLTEAQLPILRQQQVDRRYAMSEAIKQLKAEGVDKEEIDLRILEMGY